MAGLWSLLTLLCEISFDYYKLKEPFGPHGLYIKYFSIVRAKHTFIHHLDCIIDHKTEVVGFHSRYYFAVFYKKRSMTF